MSKTTSYDPAVISDPNAQPSSLFEQRIAAARGWRIESVIRAAVIAFIPLWAVVNAYPHVNGALAAVFVVAAWAIAARIMMKDAMPPASGRLRIGGHAVRMGDATTNGRQGVVTLQVVGIVFGAGALYGLVAATTFVSRYASTSKTSVGEVLFTVALLLLFIVPGLLWRPVAEFDSKSRTVKRFHIASAIPWFREAPAKVEVRIEQHPLRRGGMTPHFLTADVDLGKKKPRRISIDSIPADASKHQAAQHAALWRQTLNG